MLDCLIIQESLVSIFYLVHVIVIAYVGPKDRVLAEEIKRVLQQGKDEEGKTFSTLFSRNKMLRRRLKRRQANI